MTYADDIIGMRPRFIGYARKLVGPDEAEDMLQDTALRLAALERKRAAKGDTREIDTNLVWLALRCVCYDALRKRKAGAAVKTTSVDIDYLLDVIPDTDVYVDPTYNSEHVISFEKLTHHQAEIARLYMDGWELHEIAEMQNMSPSAVSKLMTRACRRLRGEGRRAKREVS